MKKHLGLLAFLAAMLISGLAFAQDDSKMQNISFEEDRIEGELMMPNTGIVDGKTQGELPSLVKARDDFNNDVRKSVDDI